MCHQEIYRQEGGSVSDERVEKLVEKYSIQICQSYGITYLGPEIRGEGDYIDPKSVTGLLRAAVQEARREALKEAATVARNHQADAIGPIDFALNAKCEMIAKELERLAGEEGTK